MKRPETQRHPAAGPAVIYIFPEADELDAEMIQFAEYFEAVKDRVGDAIEGLHHHDIELATASVGQEMIETGTLRLRAADLVGVFVDDLEAALCGEPAQVVEQAIWQLRKELAS